jgi:hypothetical protein
MQHASKKEKLTQSSGNRPERTHPGADDPVPQANQAEAGVSIYLEGKDSSDLGIDLCIHQLNREGAVGAARPRIHPHCHLTPPEWLDTAANEGVKEVHARQPISEQTLEDVVHWLYLTGVFLSHTVPPVGLDGGVPTYNYREQRTSVVPQEEPLFPPSIQPVGN